MTGEVKMKALEGLRECMPQSVDRRDQKEVA